VCEENDLDGILLTVLLEDMMFTDEVSMLFLDEEEPWILDLDQTMRYSRWCWNKKAGGIARVGSYGLQYLQR
jgi:hypothetical protein